MSNGAMWEDHPQVVHVVALAFWRGVCAAEAAAHDYAAASFDRTGLCEWATGRRDVAAAFRRWASEAE